MNFKQKVHAVSQVAANTKNNQANRNVLNYWLQDINFSSASAFIVTTGIPSGSDGSIVMIAALFFDRKRFFIQFIKLGLR